MVTAVTMSHGSTLSMMPWASGYVFRQTEISIVGQ